MASRGYPTDLSYAEWAVLQPLLPPACTGRPRTRDPRQSENGILYVPRAGCAWGLVPNDFGHWVTVYYYLRKWRDDGIWDRFHHELRRRERVRQGRKPEATAAIIDSQSVKTTEKGGLAAMMEPSTYRVASAGIQAPRASLLSQEDE